MKELNIEYNRFDRGIDLRKSSSVSDANRFRNILNCYITDGWAVKKRSGTKIAFTNLLGTAGLNSGFSLINNSRELVTSTNLGINTVIPVHPDLFDGNEPSWFPEMAIVDISHSSNLEKTIKATHAVITFNQVDYRIVEFTDGVVQHFYGAALVTQPTQATTIANVSSRIYAPHGDVVRYSKVNNPIDWTGNDDAGFLPVGRQASGESEVVAVSEYDNRLAVFMSDSIQIWITDEVPAQHQLEKIIRTIGTSFSKSIQSFSNDVVFLSNIGFRSISRQSFTDNRQDNDIGSPIDSLVVSKLKEIDYDSDKVISTYYPELGQYWCSIGDTCFIYTVSPSSRVAAWSVYTFNFNITAFCPHFGRLFMRDDQNAVYLFDDRESDDNGSIFKSEVLFSFQSQKAPAIRKRYNSMDVVQTGASTVSHLYNPEDLSSETAGIEISGNTRPFQRYPMGLVSTEIATRFVNQDSNEWQLDAVMYFYNRLGVRV